MYLGLAPATRRVQAALHRALAAPGPVLVSGPPGSGKRAVAELLHHYARARDQGADPRPLAYVCPIEAHPVDAQESTLDQPGDPRVVLGTHLDLRSLDARARLHPRVLQRCAVRIELPSLRERIEDLEPLVLQILVETPTQRPVGGISDAALECLRAYAWPGNLVELREVVRRALDAGTGELIELEDLPASLRRQVGEGEPRPDADPPPELALAHAERAAIERAMRYARGNKRKAARLLQIGKTTLYRKLREYGDESDGEGPDGELG